MLIARHVQPGILAWAVLALLCFVPGWYMREWLAAMAQARGHRPDFRRSQPLGLPRLNRLCAVLEESPVDEFRYIAARALAGSPDDRTLRARIHSIMDADSRVAMLGSEVFERWFQRDVDAAFYEVSEEEFLRFFELDGDRTSTAWIWGHLWVERPQDAERILTRILRDMKDPDLAKEALRGSFGLVGHRPFPEGVVRALVAGTGNPEAQIRALCVESLGYARDVFFRENHRHDAK